MRHPFRLIALAGLAGLLISCASAPADDSATKPGEVRVFRPDQFPDREYEVLGELEETEPVGVTAVDPDPYRRGETDVRNERQLRAAEERTIARLRSRAAKLDADALVVVECGRLVDPADPSTRYQETVRCVGFAVRFKVLGPDGLYH